MVQSQPSSDDPTIYPSSDDMGTSTFELLLRSLLRPLLRRWLALQNKHGFVGADQFIYWQQFNPSKVLAPDLFWQPGLHPDACPDSIKLWTLQPRQPPVFALEAVSEKKGKDYERSPRRYEELGVEELVIYDPNFQYRREGHRFQVYRKQPEGGFGKALITDEDRVWSEPLGCFLRVVWVEGSPLLRLATGSHGDDLLPTDEEAERAAREAERAAKEAAEAKAKEAEAKAKEAEAKVEAAEARVRELEALLATLRGG